MNKNNLIKVADVDQVCNGFAFSSDYDAVTHFNERVLPVLRALDLFKSRSIPDYYGVTRGGLFKAYLRKIALEDAEHPFDNNGSGLSDRDRFDAFLTGLRASTDVKAVSAVGLTFVHYDEKGGVFVIDLDAYRDATAVIYAETPEEKKALELLKSAADALSALRLDALSALPCSQLTLTLANFVEVKDGRTTVKSTMWPGAWHELVSRISK